MGGQKIIDGLKDAIAGNLDRVTIDGQVWVRRDAEIERLREEIKRLEELWLAADAEARVHRD